MSDSTHKTLIDELLDEQQQLTAVERFSSKHHGGDLPAQSRYYRDLIPLTKPAPGEQYAFGVDLDACTGCKACVSACHSLNGLEDEEIWRNVGFIHGGEADSAYQQTVTTACHHCVDPACLNGCPVKAYEKDAETGIVRHLDDQCIGCQYCVLKCPYDVPKYSKKRGIVRKCDMCYNRLAVNEAPACVQACPTGAITIQVINKAQLTADIHTGDQLLPDTFDSAYTRPSTAYTTRKVIPANARASDVHQLRLEHAHLPLIFMLVFTQAGAGLFVALAVLMGFAGSAFTAIQGPVAVSAFIALNIGLAVSVLHLGRPMGAWRAFLGLRTSWMSREILAFGLLAGMGGATTVACIWGSLGAWLGSKAQPLLQQLEFWIDPAAWARPLVLLTSVFAMIGIYCSAMIYIDTRRLYWVKELTAPKFFGTLLLLGASGAAAVLSWGGQFGASARPELIQGALLVALSLRCALSGWETEQFRTAIADVDAPQHRSAHLIWTKLRPLAWGWAGLSLAGAACTLLALGAHGWTGPLLTSAAFLLMLITQSLERYFYFTAVVAPRMPGGIT